MTDTNERSTTVEWGEHWEPRRPGDEVAGVVMRMPQPGAHHGRKLVLDGGSGTVLVEASANSGHTVLANELERQGVQAGDRVKIRYEGWADSRDGKRRYRAYRLWLMAETDSSEMT